MREGNRAEEAVKAVPGSSRVLSERVRNDLAWRLREQGWKCAYPCSGKGYGRPLLPNEPIALAYDGHGIVHADCAAIGVVPTKDNPHAETGV